MKYDQTFTIAEYVTMLEAPMPPDTSPEAHGRIHTELEEARKARDEGVKKVRLAFRRSSVNRQWIR